MNSVLLVPRILIGDPKRHLLVFFDLDAGGLAEEVGGDDSAGGEFLFDGNDAAALTVIVNESAADGRGELGRGDREWQPAAAFAVVTFDGSWKGLEPGVGTLADYWAPSE